MEISIDFSQKQLKVLGKRNKERLIPLSNEILNNLSEYLREREQEFPGDDSYLFLTEKGKAFYDKQIKLFFN